MALLAFVAFLLFSSVSAHADEPAVLQAVYYDLGNPDNSVGILSGEIVARGDLFETYSIMTFAPDAIIAKDQVTGDSIKWALEGGADENLRRKALQFFVVKQMRAIHAAQVKYFEERRIYAPELETLIAAECLADGFKDGKKYGYSFKIERVGETKRLAPFYKKVPTYLAIADPPVEGDYFFSVDQLGDVRYAASRTQVSWGPVWDYNDVLDGPESKFVGLETAAR